MGLIDEALFGRPLGAEEQIRIGNGGGSGGDGGTGDDDTTDGGGGSDDTTDGGGGSGGDDTTDGGGGSGGDDTTNGGGGDGGGDSTGGATGGLSGWNVEGVSINTTSISPGDPVAVGWTVSNLRDDDEFGTAPVMVNGNQVATIEFSAAVTGVDFGTVTVTAPDASSMRVCIGDQCDSSDVSTPDGGDGFSVSNAAVIGCGYSSADVRQGGDVRFEATVENNNPSSGSVDIRWEEPNGPGGFTVQFTLNNVSLGAGERKTVRETFAMDAPSGDYRFEAFPVGNRSASSTCGFLSVVGFSAKDVVVVNCSRSQGDVGAGEALTLTADVTNPNDQAATADIVWRDENDPTVVMARLEGVTVPAGASAAHFERDVVLSETVGGGTFDPEAVTTGVRAA